MSLSTQLRIVIWTRDRGICGLCGDRVEPADYEVDHIIHRHAGGSDAPENLRAAHRWCNRKRPDHEPRKPPRQKFNLRTSEGATAYVAFMKENSARRQRVPKLCVECGAEFVGITKARYCSPRCRVRAHYYAKKSSQRAQEQPDG